MGKTHVRRASCISLSLSIYLPRDRFALDRPNDWLGTTGMIALVPTMEDPPKKQQCLSLNRKQVLSLLNESRVCQRLWKR